MKTLSTILVLVAVVNAPVLANQEDDARRLVSDAYKRSDAATERRDLQTLLSLYAPGYKGIFKGKTISKADIQRNAETIFFVAQTLKVKTSIKKFSLVNGKAVVVAHEIASFRTYPTRNYKSNSVEMDSTFQDVWIKKGAHWMKQHTLNLNLRTLIDGKLVKTTGNRVRVAPVHN